MKHLELYSDYLICNEAVYATATGLSAMIDVTDNGRIYETDSIGNKRYDKQSYRIEGGKILPTDSIGNRQYDKPAFEMK